MLKARHRGAGMVFGQLPVDSPPKYGTIASWDVTDCTSFYELFEDMGSPALGDQALGSGLQEWDTSRVTRMTSAFENAVAFDLASIGGWDTSQVTSMWSMFQGAASFNQASIGGWDTSKVEYMNSMFQGAASFNQNSIEKWDIRPFALLTNMFDTPFAAAASRLGNAEP